ncbi:MAG: outer membrane lipoprotein carrier protein LolA, partial [Candidatus Cloacimonadota bacterium]|nr:outer membrane lipoprotein carrier protein LolA [Candidatus Cloacimonadota bacterium]
MDLWKISFIILLALPLAIFANNSKILKKIEENYDTKTFSANFSQTNFWSEIEVEKVSNGKMFYNKEKLILNYSEPVGQQLLLEGKNLSIYDKESNQLSVTKVDNAISKIKPIEIIKYYWQKSEVSISESENMLTAILLP